MTIHHDHPKAIELLSTRQPSIYRHNRSRYYQDVENSSVVSDNNEECLVNNEDNISTEAIEIPLNPADFGQLSATLFDTFLVPSMMKYQ